MQKDGGCFNSDESTTGSSRSSNQHSLHSAVVNVHGRGLTACNAHSITQAFLQKEFPLTEKYFDISDGHGKAGDTDGELLNSIEGKVPLCAALAENSSHYIENRKEELSQLQLKLMRDQISGVTEKLVQVGQQVQELAEALATSKHEHEQASRRVKHELGELVNSSREAAKQDYLQLVERVEAAYQTIGTERNRREVAVRSVEQQIQGVRETLSCDRSTRRSETAATNARLDDAKYALSEEGRCRALMETRHTEDFNMLTERIDALTTLQSEQVRDFGEQVRAVATNGNHSLQDGAPAVSEAHQIGAAARFKKVEERLPCVEAKVKELEAQLEGAGRLTLEGFVKVEERFPSIESKVAELANKQMAHYDELLTKNRKLFGVLEKVQALKMTPPESRGKSPEKQVRVEEVRQNDCGELHDKGHLQNLEALKKVLRDCAGEDTEGSLNQDPPSPRGFFDFGATRMTSNTKTTPLLALRSSKAERSQSPLRAGPGSTYGPREQLEDKREAGSAAIPRRPSPHFRSSGVAPSETLARSVSWSPLPEDCLQQLRASRASVSTSPMEPREDKRETAAVPRRSSPLRCHVVATPDPLNRSLSWSPLPEDASRHESFSSLASPGSPPPVFAFGARKMGGGMAATAAPTPQPLRLHPQSLSYATVATQPPSRSISIPTPADGGLVGGIRTAASRR